MAVPDAVVTPKSAMNECGIQISDDIANAVVREVSTQAGPTRLTAPSIAVSRESPRSSPRRIENSKCKQLDSTMTRMIVGAIPVSRLMSWLNSHMPPRNQATARMAGTTAIMMRGMLRRKIQQTMIPSPTATRPNICWSLDSPDRISSRITASPVRRAVTWVSSQRVVRGLTDFCHERTFRRLSLRILC